MKNEVIFDDKGIPSIMVTITADELAEKIGPDHPAFTVKGRRVKEISISKYQNVIIDGRAYSLPLQQPATGMDFDAARAACEAKGPGWHIMTNAEWAALALWCKANGTFPRGNTAAGKSHSHPDEHGTTYDRYRTLTGSGPATWNHDHTEQGVADLVGNVWEWIGGVRFMDGQIQIIPDNDAAAGADQSPESPDWLPVLVDGKPIRYRVEDDAITLTADDEKTGDYDGIRFADLASEIAVPELLRQLALYPADDQQSDDYIWVDSNDERLVIRGGIWGNGAAGGVFYADGYSTRSNAITGIGFRSAYIRLSDICDPDHLAEHTAAEPTTPEEAPAPDLLAQLADIRAAAELKAQTYAKAVEAIDTAVKAIAGIGA